MFKLLRYLKKIDYVFFLIIVGLIVFQVWLDLQLPDYMSTIITLLQTGSENLVNDILINGAYMLACAVGSLISAILVHFFVSQLGARLSANLRFALYGKIESFSLSEMNKFSTDSLITRTTNDVTQVQMLITMGMQSLIKAPILAVWAVIKIIGKGWEWSIATAVAVGVLIILSLVVVLFALPKFKKIQTLTDNLNRATRENLTGIRVIRANNAEEFQTNKFQKNCLS
mgnify:FL=1